MTEISYVICTHNRSDYLQKTLQGLLKNLRPASIFEIIIVDNNSRDNTKSLISQLAKESENHKIDYVFEGKQGLSFARNTGFKKASGNWIGYLDDDIMVDNQFMRSVEEEIKRSDFDVFGGVIRPYFENRKPKWIPETFEINSLAMERRMLSKDDEIWGGCMFFRKKVLLESGGFNSQLGMQGSKIAYGEDTEMIERLKKDPRLKFGINPKIRIQHVIRPEKLKLSWHVQNAIKTNQARNKIEDNSFWLDLYNSTKDLFWRFPIEMGKSLYRLVTRRNYYWQNLILDGLYPIYRIIGRWLV